MEVPMKQRIEEALRRRHRKGEEGFTLIELLVVILIIAILAAVGIIALLSALDSGRKSAATTMLRTAQSAVKAVQTGTGSTTFEDISVTSGDPGDLNAAEPDLDFDTGSIDSVGDGVITRSVSVDLPGDDINPLVLATYSEKQICYGIRLHPSEATRYVAREANGAGDCDAATLAALSTGTTAGTWQETQKEGWANP